MENNDVPDADSRLYAAVLDPVVRLMMAALGLSYLVYVLFADRLAVSPAESARHWGKPAAAYEQAIAGMPAESGRDIGLFLDLLPHACLLAVAVVSLVCVALLAVVYHRRKQKLQCRLALMQTGVFLFAISGLANRLL